MIVDKYKRPAGQADIIAIQVEPTSTIWHRPPNFTPNCTICMTKHWIFHKSTVYPTRALSREPDSYWLHGLIQRSAKYVSEDFPRFVSSSPLWFSWYCTRAMIGDCYTRLCGRITFLIKYTRHRNILSKRTTTTQSTRLASPALLPS